MINMDERNGRFSIYRLARTLSRNETGNIGVLFALAAIPVLIAGGVAVDFATGHKAKSAVQVAADAAVLAGASLTDGSDAERADLAREIFAANLPGWIAELVGEPDIDVDDDDRTVAITVAANMPTAFMRLTGIDDIEINNRAVAIRNAGHRLCILALDEDEPNSIVLNGTSSLLAPNCAVQTNSRKPNAISATGSSTGVADAFCSAGPINNNAQNLNPAPYGGCAPVQDPYANLDVPVIGGCDYTNASFSGGQHTITPGVYCGGIAIDSHAEVEMEDGLYIIKDGPLTMNSHSSLGGVNVTLYLTGTGTFIRINSHADLDLEAPEDGPYANVVVSQDPASNPGAANFFNGGGQLKIDGVVHLPTQSIELAGGGGIGSVSDKWSLIAAKLFFTGNAEVEIKADEEQANLPRILENPRLIR